MTAAFKIGFPENDDERTVDSSARAILGFLGQVNEGRFSAGNMFSTLLSSVWMLSNICSDQIDRDRMREEGEKLALGLEGLADLIRADLAKRGNGLS